MKTKYSKITSLMLGGALMLGSVACTDKFEDFNTNPYGPTPEEMNQDNYVTASEINNMMRVLANCQENDYQMLDQMIGCEYGRMTSAKNQWGTGMYYATYDPPTNWSGNMFDTTMPQIYTPFFNIVKYTGGEGLAYSWALLLRVAGTLRVSDCYGPTPYSLVDAEGGSFTVAYDDMQTLFNAMFEDIDIAIEGLKQAAASGSGQQLFGSTDLIYGGDMAKWAKYANTVKLRMAMRLVNVDAALAKQKAEECVADAAGLISDPADAAWTSNTVNSGGNALWKVSEAWEEGRASADLTSYMNGYSDPRRANYFKEASDGSYTGVRSGVYHYDLNTFKMYSLPNYGESDKLLSISASESWFCRAEGALRGWTMGGNAKDLYEQGVTVSMQERGASIGDYLDSEAVPADYVALDNTSYNISAQSTVTPKYNTGASFEENLERIIVQKWIGNYPNGWESWADFRRTGYPKWFPVVNNRNSDGVTSARGMRRLPFPLSEFNSNEANVKKAQAMLGGPDNGATDIWWAKKN